MSNAQNENGDMPQLGNKRLQSKQCPVCRAKWRYAIAESQQFAKRVMSNAQNKMAICHHLATTDREAKNVQCADQNGGGAITGVYDDNV